MRVGGGSWLGHGTVVLPGADIGRNVAVGAGSVVTGALPDFSVAVGNPARVIRRYVEGEGWVRAEHHPDHAGEPVRSGRRRGVAGRLVLRRQGVEHGRRRLRVEQRDARLGPLPGQVPRALVGVAVQAVPSRPTSSAPLASGSHQITVASSPPVRSTPFQMPCFPHERWRRVGVVVVGRREPDEPGGERLRA